jgi:hypothetical protein
VTLFLLEGILAFGVVVLVLRAGLKAQNMAAQLAKQQQKKKP